MPKCLPAYVCTQLMPATLGAARTNRPQARKTMRTDTMRSHAIPPSFSSRTSPPQTTYFATNGVVELVDWVLPRFLPAPATTTSTVAAPTTSSADTATGSASSVTDASTNTSSVAASTSGASVVPSTTTTTDAMSTTAAPTTSSASSSVVSVPTSTPTINTTGVVFNTDILTVLSSLGVTATGTHTSSASRAGPVDSSAWLVTLTVAVAVLVF